MILGNKFSHMSRTRAGVVWSAVERYSTQVVQFIISIVLARLLAPADYGLIAIVNIFLIIFQTINETGFGAALMQKLDRDELDYSSVFLFNIVTGGVLYAILFFAAPAIADFFGNQKLVLMTRIVGINLVISGFVVVQRAKLYIKVDFKTQAKASVWAATVSGIVGIILAYRNFGVMALVAQSVLNTMLNTALIWSFTGWKPQFKFSGERFKRLFIFAYKLTLARLINVVYNEIAPVFIGKFISAADLGFYNRAYGFQTMPSTGIVGVVQRVSTPLLCEQQNDLAQMRETLRKFIVKTAGIVFPAMVGLAVIAKPMIIVLLTEKWAPSITMLQIICPIGMLYVLNAFNLNIFNALNRTDLSLKLEIIKKVISVAMILLAVRYGVLVLLLTQVLVSVIELLFNTYYTRKLIGFGLWTQIKALRYVIYASLIMGATVFAAIHFIPNLTVQLIVGCSVGVLSYIGLAKLFKISLV